MVDGYDAIVVTATRINQSVVLHAKIENWIAKTTIMPCIAQNFTAPKQFASQRSIFAAKTVLKRRIPKKFS